MKEERTIKYQGSNDGIHWFDVPVSEEDYKKLEEYYAEIEKNETKVDQL